MDYSLNESLFLNNSEISVALVENFNNKDDADDDDEKQ